MIRSTLQQMKRSLVGAGLAGLLLLNSAAVQAEVPAAQPSAETLRQGERIYRTGILPSGAPVKAYVSGDVPVDGTSFTCVSCHLRSGLGSIEGEVITPPTNGRRLYVERKAYIPGSAFVPAFANYAKQLPERPAYTDETLSNLLLSGFDPTGRSVLKVMPRYDLNPQEMAAMIAYLKSLSDRLPPGVTPGQIRFATVIVEGTDPVRVESMLAPLKFGIERKNSLALAARKNDRVARMAYNMLGDLHHFTFSLAEWRLKGAPATWRAQLETYYRNEPVFALLGGISDGEWEPVHRFCEDMRLPNLLPVVAYPVISNTDWYSHYFSRGVRQEGEAAARYLYGMSELFKGRPVLQITRESRAGQALAGGFRETWSQSGGKPLVEVSLAPAEKLTSQRLKQLIAKHDPAALLIWDDTPFLAALAGFEKLKKRPGLVVTSSTTLGKQLWTIPEALRPLLSITYPYRMPHEDARFDVALGKLLKGKPLSYYDQRILRQSYITNELLGKAMMDMRGEYHRDYLFDVIGMMPDMYYPLYETVSFGPGQRYISKGCYIVQLGKGKNPRLERRSDWVIQ